jgi:ribonuclease I
MILPGAAALPPAMQLSLLIASNGPNFMDCRAAPLCGVLTLETGLGSGKYQHDQPVVHGLWPQVDNYGSSSCTAPRSAANPTALAACYAPTAPSAEAALAFERYEWGKHGVCAGTVDAADYLDQLCSLAAAPLAEMSRARRAGLDLHESAAALRQATLAEAFSYGPLQKRVLVHMRD